MNDSTSHSPVVQIPLTKGYKTIVSPEDADLSSFSWTKGEKYAVRSTYVQKKRVNIYMQRVILERILGRSLIENEYVDHKNGKPLDNTRSNLRLATRTQNQQNRKVNINNKSGYKGVTFYKRNNTWRASININGKPKTLGYYPTPEDAAIGYNRAASESFGEFALLNAVPEGFTGEKIAVKLGRPRKH